LTFVNVDGTTARYAGLPRRATTATKGLLAMNDSRFPRLAFAVAAVLMAGMPTGTLAQAPSTAYGQNTTNPNEQKRLAEEKLASYGLTNIQLRVLKHGFAGTAVKDGKPVKVEMRDNGEIRISQR
jgi:hypothetical protein